MGHSDPEGKVQNEDEAVELVAAEIFQDGPLRKISLVEAKEKRQRPNGQALMSGQKTAPKTLFQRRFFGERSDEVHFHVRIFFFMLTKLMMGQMAGSPFVECLARDKRHAELP